MAYGISSACTLINESKLIASALLRECIPEYNEAADHLMLNSSSGLGLFPSKLDVKEIGAVPAS